MSGLSAAANARARGQRYPHIMRQSNYLTTRKNMKKLAIILTFLLTGVFTASAGTYFSEQDFSDSWCNAQGGESQTVLSDGTRPDCLLSDFAVEFDFGKGMKPYECTGQALHYAAMTGKKPLCVLIKKPGISDYEYARAVHKVRTNIKCMNEKGIIINCPKTP